MQFCDRNRWKSICHDGNWDQLDANTVCNQLGYTNHGKSKPLNLYLVYFKCFHVGANVSRVCTRRNRNGYLAKISCTGTELQLSNCSFSIIEYFYDCGRGCDGDYWSRLVSTVQCAPGKSDYNNDISEKCYI